MGQFGGVNVIDVIDPRAAANATQGATAMANRQSQQQMADQESLQRGVQSLVDSISQTVQNRTAQKMQKEKIGAEKESQKSQQDFEAGQNKQRQDFDMQIEQQRMALEQQKMREQQLFNQTMLNLQNVGLEDDPTDMPQGPAGLFPGGTATPTSPSGSGSSGVSVPWASPNVMNNKWTTEDAKSFKQIQSESTSEAAKVAAAQLFAALNADANARAATSAQGLQPMQGMMADRFKQLAAMEQTAEQVRVSYAGRMDEALKLMDRNLTDKNTMSRVGNFLETNSDTMLASAFQESGRQFGSMLGINQGPQKYEQKFVTQRVTPLYLEDLADNVMQATPGADPSLREDLAGFFKGLVSYADTMRDPELVKREPQLLEKQKAQLMQLKDNLEKKGVSGFGLYSMLDMLSTSEAGKTLTQRAGGGAGPSVNGQRVLGYLHDDLARMAKTYTQALGQPKENQYRPLSAHMMALGAVMNGHQSPDEVKAFIAGLGVDPKVGAMMEESFNQYYGSEPFQQYMKDKAEVNRTRRELLNAQKEATAAQIQGKANVASKAEQRRKAAREKRDAILKQFNQQMADLQNSQKQLQQMTQQPQPMPGTGPQGNK